jgi:hypothetical protein
MSDATRKFSEVIGGRLMSIGHQSSTYVGLGFQGGTLQVHPLTLSFDRGVLTIENPFKVESRNAIYLSTGPEIELVLANLEGCVVTDAEFQPEFIVVRFGDVATISISLRDEDFTTPEAGNYAPNDGPIIVFD